jgi:hypothetical protein
VSGQCVTVHNRHPNVADNEIGYGASDLNHSLPAAARGRDLETFTAKRRGNRAQEIWLVIDHQQPVRHDISILHHPSVVVLGSIIIDINEISDEVQDRESKAGPYKNGELGTNT